MHPVSDPMPAAGISEQDLDRLYEGELTPAQEAALQSVDVMGGHLLAEFDRAVTLKQNVTLRLVKDLRQYKGIYEPEIKAVLDADDQRSNAYFRKTRAKVKAVDAKLEDLLLSGKRTWDAKPKSNPRLPKVKLDEIRKLIAASMSTEEKTVRPEEVPDEALDEMAVQYAANAARKMVKVIEDQLNQAKFRTACKRAIHSGNLYGTGVIKGPLVEEVWTKEYVYDEKRNRYTMRKTKHLAPFYNHVPLWRYYPDMEVTQQAQCRFEWEHHRLTRAGLAALADRKAFARGREAIQDWIAANPDGMTRLFDYESDLRDMGERDLMGLHVGSGLYDVFERSGWLNAEQLIVAGVKIPQDRMHEAFYSNVWILPSGKILKCTLAPLEGVQSPYKLYHFDEDETSIFGEGLASIMRDDQRRINACYRAAEDNMGITSGPQLEINLDMINLADPDNTNIVPFGKWFRKKGDGQFPAVRAIDIPSHVDELLGAAKVFEACADESTQVPKLIHGEGPVEAASALSMRMGAINIAMKGLVLSFEEGITKPAIEDTYSWNMRYHKDNDIKGDFEIEAQGATSLIAQEIQVQQAIQFGSTINAGEEMYVDRYELLKKRAELQGFQDAVRDREEAEASAKNPMVEMQQQLALQAAQSEVALMQARAAREAAAAAKTQAEVLLTEARGLNEKMGAVFAAMQAGGMAATSPPTAKAGDSLLRAAGWKDAPPELPPGESADSQPVAPPQGGPVPAQPAQADAQPVDANTGQNAGIETAAMEPVNAA